MLEWSEKPDARRSEDGSGRLDTPDRDRAADEPAHEGSVVGIGIREPFERRCRWCPLQDSNLGMSVCKTDAFPLGEAGKFGRSGQIWAKRAELEETV